MDDKNFGKKMFFEFINNLDTMIFVSDVDSCEIIYMNDKMKKEFSINEDVIGKSCFNVFDGSKGKNCKNCYEEKLSEESFISSCWNEYNQNLNKYYKNIDSFVPWADGKIVHMRQIFNITKEVMLKTDLEMAQRETEVIKDIKTDFLNRMKRNVTIPINTIKGINKIAQSTIDIRKIKQCLKKIETETKKVSDVMTGVFDMAKIENNELEFIKEPFSFENMLLGVSNNIGDRCREKSQIFQIKMDMEMPAYFTGDEHRISQVLTNLLTNSVKYTPKGGKIQIEVCQISLINGISTIELTVSDTGFGMSEKQQETIQTLFAKKQLEKYDEFNGLGLGLPICKNIVDNLGGNMKLYSSTKIGTTISFVIKLEVFESKFFERKLSPGLNIKNLNVLLVDGSVETCEYFRKIMKGFKIGYETTTTYLGLMDKLEDANLNKKPYNIIFLDVNLKDIDSISIIKLIAKKFPTTNIVVLDQKDSKIDKDLFVSAGAERFIKKPLFPSLLMDIINEIVSIPNKGQMTYFSKKYDFYGRSILLVEDVEINQEIVKKFLKETKVKVYSAENGLIAYEMFKEDSEKYDLILMDINMPEMDGFETAKKIRKLSFSKAQEIPIIALTANSFDEDVKKCLAVGMNDHIKKPIEPEEVLEKLVNYLPKESETFEKISPEQYINISEALRRVKGNVKVYKALLGSFAKNTKFYILKDEVEQGNYDKAQKIAHSIKGAAANLSLTEVYNVMTFLEQQLGAKQNVYELIEEAENVLNSTIKSIEIYLLM